jgi:hypothetical protein
VEGWDEIQEAKYWTWASLRQLTRVRESFAVWWEQIQADLGSVETATQRVSAHLMADQHFLLNAGANLVKALARIDGTAPWLSTDTRNALRNLRDTQEHWEQHRPAFDSSSAPKNRAGKKLVELWPDAHPWSYSWSDEGTFIGRVFRIETFADELVTIERELLRREGRTP